MRGSLFEATRRELFVSQTSEQNAVDVGYEMRQYSPNSVPFRNAPYANQSSFPIEPDTKPSRDTVLETITLRMVLKP